MAISYGRAEPTLSLEARENAFKDADGLRLVALLQVNTRQRGPFVENFARDQIAASILYRASHWWGGPLKRSQSS